MKKFYPFLAVLFLLAVGCTQDEPETSKLPTVILSDGSTTSTTLTFNATVSDATSAAYLVLEDGEESPALEEILSKGTAITISDEQAVKVEVSNLSPETSYQVVAAASNGERLVGSNTLFLTTLAPEKISIEVEIVQLDHEKMNFRVSSQNAQELAYIVMYSSKPDPDASYIFINGESIEVGTNESIEVSPLESNTEYKLVVAGRSGESELVIEPIIFTTDDDPANVISHDYTHAKGFKWGSNAYIMLSYGDSSGEIVYDEKMLCLDFYADEEKDYLPAGVYEVQDNNEAPVLSTFYSTYGYEDGVKFQSGSATVEIDSETKAYTISIDIYLIDGRHLVANYTGDIDGMEVVDIVTIESQITEAYGTRTANDGSQWFLELSEPDNLKLFLAVNSFPAEYLPANSYTISVAGEDVLPGEFDIAASAAYLNGEMNNSYPFATGTLHVDIDWENQAYLISFFGTLEDGTIIEAEYNGAVEGISLDKSTTVTQVEMTKASARSYDSGANWYLTFTNDDESYRLVVDAYCVPSAALPEGKYTFGTGAGTMDQDATTLTISSQTQYSLSDGVMDVQIDYENKLYIFSFEAVLEDGRTYQCQYTGEVLNMPVVEKPSDGGEHLIFSTATVKQWYSNNFQLVLTDENGLYKVELDLRSESYDFISSGTYTLSSNSENYSISSSWSYFYFLPDETDKFYYSDAELVVEYDQSADKYTFEVELVLTDGRTYTGTFDGEYSLL